MAPLNLLSENNYAAPRGRIALVGGGGGGGGGGRVVEAGLLVGGGGGGGDGNVARGGGGEEANGMDTVQGQQNGGRLALNNLHVIPNRQANGRELLLNNHVGSEPANGSCLRQQQEEAQEAENRGLAAMGPAAAADSGHATGPEGIAHEPQRPDARDEPNIDAERIALGGQGGGGGGGGEQRKRGANSVGNNLEMYLKTKQKAEQQKRSAAAAAAAAARKRKSTPQRRVIFLAEAKPAKPVAQINVSARKEKQKQQRARNRRSTAPSPARVAAHVPPEISHVEATYTATAGKRKRVRKPPPASTVRTAPQPFTIIGRGGMVSTETASKKPRIDPMATGTSEEVAMQTRVPFPGHLQRTGNWYQKLRQQQIAEAASNGKAQKEKEEKQKEKKNLEEKEEEEEPAAPVAAPQAENAVTRMLINNPALYWKLTIPQMPLMCNPCRVLNTRWSQDRFILDRDDYLHYTLKFCPLCVETNYQCADLILQMQEKVRKRDRQAREAEMLRMAVEEKRKARAAMRNKQSD